MKGHEVVAVDTADDIGKVRHVVVSQSGDRIERLHIDGRGRRSVFAEWDDLESFGNDRVMVKRADEASESDDERDRSSARGSLDILQSRILDTAGFEHGVVDDVTFDSDSGAIVGVTSSTGVQVSADDVRSFGSYALVVDGSNR
ncbi:MAG: PRC-barrel domain-containing protein [Ilumatobacter sp.]|uniref:PRC-barrel domain-containing protein n=1 Tax=Ilumatobacter sp. TaxID=1967498 RepID=UPI00391C9365